MTDRPLRWADGMKSLQSIALSLNLETNLSVYA
jgi:hypothetical protein